MAKIYNLSQKVTQINFNSPARDFELYYQSFLSSPLGLIYQSIPWQELVRHFGLQRKSYGRPCIFDGQGKLALMFLKAYTAYSDRKLIERLNTDYSFQFFCGIYLHADERLADYKIVSKIRSHLSKGLDIAGCQKILARYWRPYLDQTHVLLLDATCYESDLRYPTHVKLLWESVDWTYRQMKKLCKLSKLRMPRSRYGEQKSKYLAYQRSRKKPYKQKHKRIKSLLYLLNKLIDQLDIIEQQLPAHILLTAHYQQRRAVIRQVLVQEQALYHKQKVTDRIVSIDKSYIHPIVRGKEVKRVEFGAKVNMLQVDKLNFIEHINFSSFHEGKRLKQSHQSAQILFGKVTHIGADAIYGINENRRYCKQQNIVTSFKRKGRAGKHEQQRKQISGILNKARSSRMEGSFGLQKNHYSLNRIKAKGAANECLWIFFGVHMANAVEIAHRKAREKIQQAA